MKSKTTRRAVMAGVASLPALAVPAIASPTPDAELIQLGNELAALWPEHERRLEALNEIGDRAWELAEQRTGIKHPGGENIRDMRTGEFDRLLEAMFAAQKELELPNYESRFLEFSNKADRLMKRIESLPASSAAGLAAKAVPITFINSKLWDEPAADQDIDQRQVRLLIDAVFALGGIDHPATQQAPQS